MFMLQMPMDGQLCIMHHPKCVLLPIIDFDLFLNQTSKGYLNIVQWLCEEGGAASATDTGRGIDIRSKVGWTPLSNFCFLWLLSFGI